MLTITGNTFQHREYLKSIRARFDPVRKCWTHPGGEHEAALRALAGVSVTGESPRPLTISLTPAKPTINVLPVPADTYDGKPALHGNSRWLDYFAIKGCKAHFGFDDISHQIDFMRKMPIYDDVGREIDDRPTQFTGTMSWEHALDMLENGTWYKGTELAAEIVEYFNVHHAKQKHRKNSIAGGSVNVGRMLAGNPKHMVSRRKRDGRKIITLFVDVSMGAEIIAENAIIRAALVAALCDMLENHGYSCEIIAVDAATHLNKPIYTLTVELKQAGNRLNLSDIIFALGHPSYLRRIIFSILCSEPATKIIWRHGMGNPVKLFNERHATTKREIYIEMLTGMHQSYITGGPIERALKMFKYLVPKDFPIEVKL